MSKTLFSLLFFCGALLLTAAEPVAVKPQEILFLAHFNHSLTPEVGNGEGIINKGELTAGAKGVPFTNSAPTAEALNVAFNRRYVAYPAAGNVNTERGTLQMYIKGQWDPNKYSHCVFFKLFFNEKLEGDFGGTNSFLLQKTQRVQRFRVFQNGNLRDSGVSTTDIPYSKDTWYHLTVTWDVATKKYSLFLNGELIGSKPYRKMTKAPLYFTLGHPGGHNAQSLIDEVRILNRVLTPAEVKQDYEYLKSGKEFPAPTAESRAVIFEPKPAEKELAGFEASLEPVNFQATGLKREVKLDGKLSDPAWKSAALIPDMKDRNSKTAIGPKTEVRVLYSPTALYIGAVMHEPDMKNLVAQFDQNDLQIYNDDCLELLLDLTGRPNLYYHIAVNALGSIFDSCAGKKNWNGQGFVAKTSRHADKWIVELKLPYAAFNASKPEPGEFWGMRFARERHHDRQPAVAVPIALSGPLGARRFLGKLSFAPVAGTDIKLSSSASKFTLGTNSIPLEITAKEPVAAQLRARIYDGDSAVLSEKTQKIQVPGKLTFAMPVETDTAQRAVITLLDAKGEALDSVTLQQDFPFVAPGFIKLEAELKHLANGCADLLGIRHPVHMGAAKSVEKMQEAIAAFRADIKSAVAAGKTVPAEKIDAFAALSNGFRHYRHSYNYLVWQTSPWESGSPNALPQLNYTPELELNFRQASNERERVTLVLSGLLSGRRLDLRVVPCGIDQRNKTYVSRDRFEIYMEPFTVQNGQLDTNALIRVPGNIITLTPGNAVRVHVVFNSRGVPAGKYQTKLLLKPLSDYSIPDREIPVNMEVWNFTLPETRDWPIDCFFWGPNRLDNDETAMLKLMHSRHINWGWTEIIRYIRGFNSMRRVNRLPEGQIFNPELVKTANEEFFQTAKALGMRFVFGWGTCDSVEWHQLMDERLLKMGFTRKDFIFKAHLADEFKKSQIPRHADTRAKIAAINPGWTFQAVYLSTPPPSGATLKDIEDAKLTDTHKNWTIISGLLRKSPEQTKEVIDFFKSRGCKLWAYQCSTSMHSLPVLEYYRFFPWFGYQKKLDGVAIWTSVNSGGSNDHDGLDHRDGYDDGSTFLDNNRQPIPTKRLEAVSEGLEDVAYMFELDKQLKRLEGKIPEADRAKYQALITTRLSEIMTMASQKQVDEWRLAVGTAIDALSKQK